MNKKPLKPGDNVQVKYTVQVHGNDCVVYLDGKLLNYEKGAFLGRWLIECQLTPEFNALVYTNWWDEKDIISKHYLATTDEEYFEKAEKISAGDYTGLVYYDDQYFESINDFLEWANYNHYPKFVWVAEAKPVKLNLDLISSVSESIEDNGYEGLSESMQFKKLFQELRSIQDKFTEAAAKNVVYQINYKRAILL